MTTETVEPQTDEQATRDFAAGFDNEATPAAPAATEPPSDQAGRAPVEVEYVQVTKGDFDRLMAAAEKAETVDQQFAKVFGTIGNVKNEVLNRLQAQTASGADIQLSDEDFAELQEDFPSIAGQTKTALERIFKRMNLRGTGGQPATVEADPEKIRETFRAERVREQLAELDDLHPDWRDVVGRPGDETNAFRRWLKDQPEDYRKRVEQTESAAITSRAIDRFKASLAKPAEARQPEAPRDRRADAVQPRGTGTAPPPRRSTPEDDLRAGYESG